MKPIQFAAIAGFLLMAAIGILGLLLAPPEAVGFAESGSEPTLAVIIAVLAAVLAVKVVFEREASQ